MARARVRIVKRTTTFGPPARPLLSPFNRALGLCFFGVTFAYLLTLLELHGVALVAMLAAFLGLVAASAARR